jgi:multidrug efflux system membrane fusion protein
MKSLSTIIVLTLLVIAGCKENPANNAAEAPNTQIIPVKVEPVMENQTVSPILTSGVVAANEEIRLSFKIGGVIRSLYTKEGAWVKKGQLLARLDPQEINAQVAQAESGLAKAQRDLDRAQKLYQDTVTTLEVVQNLTTALEVAESQLKVAKFNQQYAEIYAPASGRILKKFAQEGEMIGPGNPVYYLAATNSPQVIRTSLTDVDVVKINYGDKAQVFFDAWPRDTFSAKVSEIAAGTDPMTGTFEVELSLDAYPKAVKNGFIGKVQLLPSREENRVLIPIAAVVEANADVATIYIPGDTPDQVTKLKLKNYRIENDHVSVFKADLKGARMVITDGAPYLKAESQVNIVNASETPDSNMYVGN